MRHFFGFCTLILLLLLADNAFAAIDNKGILNSVVDEFRSAATAWEAIILNYAERLFWILGTIALVHNFANLFMDGADQQKILAHFFRFTVTFGFFLWLLKNGSYFGETIIDSMIQMGAKATGQNTASPSGFVDIAFSIFDRMLDSLSIWSPLVGLAGILIGLLLLIILALVAANLAIEYCAAWVLLYAGCFFLGFGGSDWTSDMAKNYFRSVLGVAVRLMSMTMTIGIAASIITNMTTQMDSALNLRDCACLLVTALILLALMNKIPNMLSSIVGGGQSMGNLGTGAVMAAAGLAAAVGSFAGGLLGGKADGGSGGGSTAVSDAISMGDSLFSDGTGGTGDFGGADSPDSGEEGGLSGAFGQSSSFGSPVGDGDVSSSFSSKVDDADSGSTEKDEKKGSRRSGNKGGKKSTSDYLTQSARDLGNDLEK